MGKCLYCGKEITRKDKKCKYCSYECAALYYKANRKYRESPKPRKDTLIKRSKKAKEELKRLELQERRDNINKLIKETGMHYGEVAYYYDNNKVDELYKRAEYLKSIEKIKPNDGEHKIVKSYGGKLKGGFDYFIISTK
ncbi:hypothetical protein [Megamonas funiformis]|jgi:hypothetical protein|uniref:hypothetical protein n=1 Tax=Megamonas funiformis TaxID=437897 RepID=UPI00205B0B40|nr:hypothetical protein [Megamonas funiformis]DAN15424.1 MAG TPA: Protein of unknown function (DUF2089) [Caudoviricetes sp.]